jgi:hypothetical protein
MVGAQQVGEMQGYQGGLRFCSGSHFNVGQVLIKERLFTWCKFIQSHLRKHDNKTTQSSTNHNLISSLCSLIM